MSGRRAVRPIAGATPEAAHVHDSTLEGQGVATLAGKRVFVDQALAGEDVTLLRRRRHRNYDEAELVSVERASPHRARPPCACYWRCGGCSLQHVDPAGQVGLKQETLLAALERLGRVVPREVLPPVTGPAWGYRRRARLAVRDVSGKGRVLVGFRERLKPYVTDMRDCHTLAPAGAGLLGPLSDLIGRLSLRARLPQVELAVGDAATALVLRVLQEPTDADREHLGRFRAEHGVRLWLERSDGQGARPLDESLDGGDLWYELAEPPVRIAFGPADFVQVNAAVNRQLVPLALRLLSPGRDSRVLDLYCGVGNFSVPLARVAGEVLGLELAPAMVERAGRNAALNGLRNARFAVADLAAEGASPWPGGYWDGALLDPPRTGAAALLPALAAAGPRRILYVSCHPGTLARDAGVLVHEHGYDLAVSGILDMFPQTSHVEAIALFEKR